MDFPHVVIGGARVAVASREQICAAMVRDCMAARAARRNGISKLVFDVNGEALSLRQRNARYREALDCGHLIHADGQFIVALSKLLTGEKIPERSAMTDMIYDILQAGVDAGLSFYFLGAPWQVVDTFVRKARQDHPKLIVAGYRDGYFSASDEPAVIEQIRKSQADVVLVGMGKAREVPFSVRLRPQISAGWVATVGGCFHHVVGDYRRAPIWMQKSGTEWLFRMLTDRRVFWRYLVTTPHALVLAIFASQRGIR